MIRLIESFGKFTIRNSKFLQNKASSIGVLYSVLANQTEIDRCEFSSNEVENDVGVMSLTN